MLNEFEIFATGRHVEHYKFWTVFGSPGSGKSTLLMELARDHVSKGWTPVVCDPPERRSYPQGCIRVRTVDQAQSRIAHLQKAGHRALVFMHGEARSPGVARAGHVHPWIEWLAVEHRHRGPSMYLASQTPTLIDVDVRKTAHGSYLLHMGCGNLIQWVKNNFGPETAQAVARLPDPKAHGGWIRVIKATEDRGLS